MSEKNETTDNCTLFPELLSIEELRSSIERRYPALRNINKMTHEEGVKVFRAMLMPLPQREYLSNSRGRLLRERRTRSGLQAQSEPNLSLSSVTDKPLLERAASTDRLKPPPDLAACSKIRLSSSSVNASHSRNTAALEKIVIKKRTQTTDAASRDAMQTASSKRVEAPSSQTLTETTAPTKSKRMKITWP